MLVPSMNNQEIRKELENEFNILNNSSTIVRFYEEYHRERIRSKIKKEARHIKYFEIKTKNKNNWVFMLTKDPLKEKYHEMKDAVLQYFTYYHSSSGIRVFVIDPKGLIVVYNNHFFNRYRERMNLDIPNLLDVVKLYKEINYGVYFNHLPEKDGIIKTIAHVKEGFMMGEYIKAIHWYENKTFISKATANFTSTSLEKGYLDAMEGLFANTKKGSVLDPDYELRMIYESMKPSGNKE